MGNEALLLILVSYMLLMSVALFVLMGVDKKRAARNEWRIKERTLFFIALIGGALGGIVGMRVFRHKTKHALFAVGMPLLLMLNLGAAYLLMYLNGNA
jgi:uncharacterized membrane protein YsdA (DUF1294 family)